MSTSNQPVHVAVLVDEVLSQLRAEQGGYFMDCTFGGGGHTAALLNASMATKVFAIDRDKRAIERGLKRFDGQERVELRHSSFRDIPSQAQSRRFQGVLADLGLSTFQLEEQRGFSFKDNSALDMRMDESVSRSAAEVINETGERELVAILKRGGVGSEARAVASAIVKARPILNTRQLTEIIVRTAFASASGRHPATVIFQAIRIEVNDEFGQIEAMLSAMPALIEPGGRLAVITFHSLEDKLVTHQMREWEGENAPAHWAGSAGAVKRLGKILTKKPIVPSEEEIQRNPASRSARLRVFEFQK